MRLLFTAILCTAMLAACDNNFKVGEQSSTNKLSAQQNAILQLGTKANEALKNKNSIAFNNVANEMDSLQKVIDETKRIENWGCFIHDVLEATSCTNQASKARILCGATQKTEENQYDLCVVSSDVDVSKLKNEDFIYFSGEVATNKTIRSYCNEIGCSFSDSKNKKIVTENNDILVQLYSHSAALEASISSKKK